MTNKTQTLAFIVGCIALIVLPLVGFDYQPDSTGLPADSVARFAARPGLQNATATAAATRTPTVTATITATTTATTTTLTTSQSGGIILLNPFSGPSASPVTANGQRWQPDDRVIVYIVDAGQEFAIGSTIVQPDGTFELSFFIPALFADQRTVTILARTLDSGESAQALYAFTDIDPEPTPTLESRSAQGEVTTESLNVRSGPGVNYPRIGQVELGEVVEINGVNEDWWRITYPHSLGDYGWVSGAFIDAIYAGDVPFFPAPPTPIPTPTVTPTPSPPPQLSYACNPGQWSGCGGASCQTEYVSQCGTDGQWGQCVWDPGSCSVYSHPSSSSSSDDDDDDSDDDDDGDDDDNSDKIYNDDDN
ncbi:MAG: SH3 domain-containing protein [Anaerolineae bacterium]|nr:SH3 domain-containing protein [Anaerolineae bacterium]